MDTPRTPNDAPDMDRDPRTGAPDVGKAPFPDGGADEGGVKTADGDPPSPDSPLTPGGVEGEGKPEREADPSISIESVNGDRADERDGGMIGEGGS
jgi:hypothetical protein